MSARPNDRPLRGRHGRPRLPCFDCGSPRDHALFGKRNGTLKPLCLRHKDAGRRRAKTAKAPKWLSRAARQATQGA